LNIFYKVTKKKDNLQFEAWPDTSTTALNRVKSDLNKGLGVALWHTFRAGKGVFYTAVA